METLTPYHFWPRHLLMPTRWGLAALAIVTMIVFGAALADDTYAQHQLGPLMLAYMISYIGHRLLKWAVKRYDKPATKRYIVDGGDMTYFLDVDEHGRFVQVTTCLNQLTPPTGGLRIG